MKSPPTMFNLHSLFQAIQFNIFLVFFLFNFFSVTYGSPSNISYSDHCASLVPELNPTDRVAADEFPFLQPGTSYFTGGEKIFGKKSSGYSVSFYPRSRNAYATTTTGIYKIQAYLTFRILGMFGDYSASDQNYSSFGQSHRPWRRRSLRFLLDGFWSEHSRKLCMVGSASWQPERGKLLQLEAVFKLEYAPENSTIFTSMVKGTLESTTPSKYSRYFDPINILSFPSLTGYSYKLVSKELDGGCGGGIDIPQSQSLSLKPKRICSVLFDQPYDFVLLNASGCKNSENCGPLQGDIEYLLRSLSLYAIQCFEEEEKLRYIIKFPNSSYPRFDKSFDPKTTLIGEGSWQRKKNQLCIVACRILSPTNSLGDAHVEDCSIRLSLRFPAIWTIKNTNGILGQIWTNKTVNDPGYFKRIMFRGSIHYGWTFPGLKYKYTEVDRVRNWCPAKKSVKKDGNKYPNGNSYDMRFDTSVKLSEEKISWGQAVPISVSDELYQGYSVIMSDFEGESSGSTISEDNDDSSFTKQMNISYKISFNVINFENQFSSLNLSVDPRGELGISAEGVYDAEIGLICMVGCRELYLNPQSSIKESLDCEIQVNFDLPPLDSKERSFVKGTIQSKREKNDPLYFDRLNISAAILYTAQVQRSIWRMDLEITMVLISNTFACVFVALQLFYIRKHPEKLPFISLVMLTILTLGHLIPLVLNFEALILKSQYQQNVILKGSGWLEVNEVSVRLITMVAFLLLFRLLQLAWTAKMRDGNDQHSWAAEKQALFVSLPLYTIGGLIALLVNWKKNGSVTRVISSQFDGYPQGFAAEQQSSTLKSLRSYAGLILDGFLFPQILLNIFQNSRESALCRSFYIGTTLARLLPHAYDLYRIHNYIHQDFDASFIYANHNADFYSIAWDVIIPCGCILFAVIIWLQQRFGGRCVLPQKLRELELYEKVPVVSNE